MWSNIYWPSCKVPVILLAGLSWNFNFHNRFSKNSQSSNFMKIRPLRAEFFHADRRTDMTKLICKFANALKWVQISWVREFWEYEFVSSDILVWDSGYTECGIPDILSMGFRIYWVWDSGYTECGIPEKWVCVCVCVQIVWEWEVREDEFVGPYSLSMEVQNTRVCWSQKPEDVSWEDLNLWVKINCGKNYMACEVFYVTPLC
jgi:hypothetical protein